MTGQNGETAGSAAYFAALNREHWIAAVMLRPETWDYAAVLREVAARAADTAEQVWNDLNTCARLLRHLPAEDRAELARVMEGLAEVCALGGAGTRRCEDCVGLLKRSDGDTPAEPGAEGRERLEGEAAVSGDGALPVGRCGYAIGSAAYLAYVEERVFLGELPPGVGGRRGNRAYRQLLETSLEAVARQLERDLEQLENGCVIGENTARLRRAAQVLAGCGAGCLSNAAIPADRASFSHIPRRRDASAAAGRPAGRAG